jgi:eukaryotic-like serine/threonine-protein kinase
VVLYEMLAGRPPFEGATAVELALHHLHDAPPPLPPQTPKSLAELVERALAKDPAERFRDGRELEAALAVVRTLLLHAPEPASALTGEQAADDAPTQIAQAAANEPRSRPRPRSTRVAPPRSRRRNFQPAERRQRVLLLFAVVMLALGMGAAAVALAPGNLRVPNLSGMSKRHVIGLGRRLGFHPVFSSRYSSRPRGTAIAQTPRPNARVGDAASIRVILSAGPAPVRVPELVGRSGGQARTLLAALKLQGGEILVPAPGVSPGTVTHESPAAGTRVPPGSKISLAVAEQPRLRPLTTLSGDRAGRSVPFRIRGKQWAIHYSMGYEGTCTFIFFCSGPTATVTNVATGSRVDQFDLGDGSSQNRAFKSGPAVYQIAISSGSDTARWKIVVEDYY